MEPFPHSRDSDDVRDGDYLSFGDDEPPQGQDGIKSESNYRLEALEPRILLSADPISGEFARLLD